MYQGILQNLFALNEPIGVLEREIKKVPSDIEAIATITYKDIEAILNRFINNEISENDIERWAELIECRDGIAYEHTDGKMEIEHIIFLLANPEINTEISKGLILELAKKI